MSVFYDFMSDPHNKISWKYHACILERGRGEKRRKWGIVFVIWVYIRRRLMGH